MDIEQVKEFIETNKESEEVSELVNSFKVEPTLEVFKDLTTKNNDFKSYMDSVKDQHLSKGLDTWKENNLEKIVNEKVREINPPSDPKDIEMEELRQEMNKIRTDAKHKDLMNLALQEASERKLPTELLKFFIGEDEETTLANMELLDEIMTSSIEETVKSKMQGTGDRLHKNKTDFKGMKKEEFDELTYTEKTELYTENKSLYDELTK